MEKDQTDHSGGEITDYEDDIREHTEDENETQDEGDDQGGNTSFLLFLSQHGNLDGKSESSREKEREETRETKDTKSDEKLTAKTVKTSAVGG